jgi:hypothetical protein
VFCFGFPCRLRSARVSFLFPLLIRETLPKVLAINAENGVSLPCRDSGIGSAFVLRPRPVLCGGFGFCVYLPRCDIGRWCPHSVAAYPLPLAGELQRLWALGRINVYLPAHDAAQKRTRPLWRVRLFVYVCDGLQANVFTSPRVAPSARPRPRK